MEPVRPHVDAFVLNLARTRTFSAKDFAETREGACRLASSLTHELTQTMATWAKLIAPYAEAVVRHVACLAKSGLGVSAPIGPMLQSDRVRVKVRARPIAPPRAAVASRSVPMSALSNACQTCGAKLAIRKRKYCDACLPDRRGKVQRSTVAAFQARGPARLATMRAKGHDPTNTPEARRRRSASASAQRQAVASWCDDGSLDGVDFRRDILPKLQDIPVRTIADAMGSSISHGSKVRNGHVVPHKRHWVSLDQLA